MLWFKGCLRDDGCVGFSVLFSFLTGGRRAGLTVHIQEQTGPRPGTGGMELRERLAVPSFQDTSFYWNILAQGEATTPVSVLEFYCTNLG